MKNFEKNQKRDIFKSYLLKEAVFSPIYEFPILKVTNFKPARAIPFEKIKSTKQYDQWVHFYMHDVKFERIWNNPSLYLQQLKKFEGVITPDFSLYRELPLSMQIWNTYRNRSLGYWMQSNGVRIIPNIRWGDERTFSFAFEGIEKGGTVAVSTLGNIRNDLNRYYFKKGLGKMIEVLEPKTIVSYSSSPKDIFEKYVDTGIELITIENYAVSVRKAVV